jgi:hypothetical protein
LFPEVLEHDNHPEDVYAYAARLALNLFDKDELMLVQAKKSEADWPRWEEARRTEFSPWIVKNDVFELIEFEVVPVAKQGKIFNLLICQLDKHQEITKYKASLVMDSSIQQIGVDIFDTYAPVIDYWTVCLLMNLAFGNNWEKFHWDISVAFTNAKAEEEKYVRFP